MAAPIANLYERQTWCSGVDPGFFKGGGRNKIDHCQYIMRIAGEVTQLYTEC